jgi:hypothetical protein
VFSRGDIDDAEVEEVRVGVVAVDFQDFGDEPSSRSALDLNHDIQRITDVCFDRAKAKVNPDTTMATRDNPRAMVLVKACCKTLTAFSQGEFVWANAGAASTSPISDVTRQRAME